MTDSKISALPASTIPLAGIELLPIVQGANLAGASTITVEYTVTYLINP